MSITTIDGLIAGFQPPRFINKVITGVNTTNRFSFWGASGIPSAGAYDTTLNGVALTAPIAGQIPFTNPPGGQSAYVARLSFVNQIGGVGLLMLCDRLWHNGGISATSTSAQTITSPTWPARDSNGATLGDGVLLGVEVSAATGNADPNITIAYTNSAGTGSRTALQIGTAVTLNNSPAGTFVPIGLQAGDGGVRSVQSLTLSTSWLSGTINLVAYRVVSVMWLDEQYWMAQSDVLGQGLPVLYNGSVPFILYYGSSAATSVVSASVVYAQG